MESLENFKKKLLQRKEKLKEVEEKRDKLKVECLDLQALCEKLTSKNTEYEEQISLLRDDLDKCHDEQIELKSKFERLEKELESLNYKSGKTVQSKTTPLKKSIEKINEEIEKLAEKAEQRAAEKAGLEHERDILEAQYSELKESSKVSGASHTDVQFEAEVRKTKALKQRLGNLESELAQWKEKTSGLQKELDEIEQLIS